MPEYSFSLFSPGDLFIRAIQLRALAHQKQEVFNAGILNIYDKVELFIKKSI
jgi:hypothetical protein